MIVSACFGSVITPTAAVIMGISSFIAVENGTWNPGDSGIFRLATFPPEDTSIKSIPISASFLAVLIVSSISQP